MNKFSIPSNKSLIPSYSDSSAFLDPDENLGQILFKPKQEYVPRDLNSKNSDRILSRKVMQKSDVLNELNIDPLKEYKNVRMLSHFVTEIGFIKPRIDTGLSTKNQKRVAKAIRRARSMGRIF